jgi:hypothetical protein
LRLERIANTIVDNYITPMIETGTRVLQLLKTLTDALALEAGSPGAGINHKLTQSMTGVLGVAVLLRDLLKLFAGSGTPAPIPLPA